MSSQNQYSRLKTRVIKFQKASPPSDLIIDIGTKHLIVNILCPEIPSDIEREINRLNLKPYELAVRAMGNSDYLYDLTELEPSQTRYLKRADLIALHTVPASTTCVVIVSYLEFID